LLLKNGDKPYHSNLLNNDSDFESVDLYLQCDLTPPSLWTIS